MRLIDAEALEEHKFVGNKFVINDYQQGWNDAIDAIIDNAPTIEERPKGKWIEYDDDGLYAGECSCCKWKAVLYESNVLNMNFCPNCGADMRKEDQT